MNCLSVEILFICGDINPNPGPEHISTTCPVRRYSLSTLHQLRRVSETQKVPASAWKVIKDLGITAIPLRRRGTRGGRRKQSACNESLWDSTANKCPIKPQHIPVIQTYRKIKPKPNLDRPSRCLIKVPVCVKHTIVIPRRRRRRECERSIVALIRTRKMLTSKVK